MERISIKLNGHVFDAMEVAENYEDMCHGLETRKTIAENEGMIYVFDEARKADFINCNPILAIDAVMVNHDGMIGEIFTMAAQPQLPDENAETYFNRLPRYGSDEDCLYVFEFAAGTAEKIGLRTGERFPFDLWKLRKYRNAWNIKCSFRHGHVALPELWRDAAVAELKSIMMERDDFYDLNLKYAGAKFDLSLLAENSWKALDGIDGKNIWLEKHFPEEKGKIVCRLFCSSAGHWRYLSGFSVASDGSFLEFNLTGLPDGTKQDIQNNFSNALLADHSQSVEEELEAITCDLSIEEEWDELYKKFYLWTHEFKRLRQQSIYYDYRLLYGMLRFGRFCDYDSVLGDTLIAASNLGFRKGMAALAELALTRDEISTNAYFWNAIGYALDRLKLKEHALYCFATAWNLDQDPTWGKNIWLMGAAVLPSILSNRDWKKLLPIASIMASSTPKGTSAPNQAELYCMIGFYHENRNDMQEAERYYKMGWDAYVNNQRVDYERAAIQWDMPLLYQSLLRCSMKNEQARCDYFSAQLESFPKTPLEEGFQHRIPVTYVEGDGHGDHWTSVVAEELLENPEDFFGTMIRDGKVRDNGSMIPEYERGSGNFERATEFCYQHPEDIDAPVEACFLLGDKAQTDEHHFASAFPVFKRGEGCKLVRVIDTLNVWSNAIEATADFVIVNDNSLSFFMPDYCAKFLILKKGAAYEVELAGFAYELAKFEEKSWDIESGFMLEEEKLKLRKAGEDDDIKSVKVTMADDFCNLSRSFGSWQDDVTFTAKIATIDEFSFMGSACYRLTVQFDDRGADMLLPIFIRKDRLRDGYIPQPGDTVEGVLWLQGFVGDEVASKIESEKVSESESGEHNDFWGNGLFTGLRGTDHDLAAMLERALAKKANAENIRQFQSPLPGDPDFSCRIDGKIIYVKALTGYYSSEDEFRLAWNEFKEQLPKDNGFEPLHLVSIVGILLSAEQYKIYYNGFAALNQKSSDTEEDELDLQ